MLKGYHKSSIVDERVMKNSKKCPKCQSTGIVKIGGTGNVLVNAIKWPWNTVKVTKYLCASCGYLENWVDAAEDVARVKKKFGAAPG
jgi:predicted nucleic-acid-binding Zn-ribbon protein